MGKVAGGAGRGATRRAVTGGGTGGMTTAERERLAAAVAQAFSRPSPEAPAAMAQAPVPPAAAPQQTAGLLSPTRVSVSDSGRRIYSFDTTDGNYVDMTVSSAGAITFAVNGDYNRQTRMSGDTANAITLRLMRQIREDARTRPDGFEYHANANQGDGYGGQRAISYEAIGMSRPFRGEPGEIQYGVVRGGKLTPDLEKLRDEEGRNYHIYNSQWQQVRDSYRRNR